MNKFFIQYLQKILNNALFNNNTFLLESNMLTRLTFKRICWNKIKIFLR